MDERCDGKADCQDWSDEEECKAFIAFPGYNKYLVPPPLGNESTLTLNLSINIDEIITIDENNGYFKIKMTLARKWFNTQLTYQNLKRSMEMNTMSTEDIKSL